MIKFISFADKKYKNTLERIKNEAITSNFFDDVKIFNENNLPQEMNDYCLKNFRGYGYWIWKPYLVHITLNELKNNDILVYSDAGCTINKNGKERFSDYINLINNSDLGNISFQMDHLEKTFTKGEVFNYFDAYDLLETGQIANSVIILRKNEHTNNIVKIWYESCLNYRNLIDDSRNNILNDPTFRDHRHDQSVFSIIRKKYGTIFLTDESFVLNNGKFDLKYPIWASRKKF